MCWKNLALNIDKRICVCALGDTKRDIQGASNWIPVFRVHENDHCDNLMQEITITCHARGCCVYAGRLPSRPGLPQHLFLAWKASGAHLIDPDVKKTVFSLLPEHKKHLFWSAWPSGRCARHARVFARPSAACLSLSCLEMITEQQQLWRLREKNKMRDVTLHLRMCNSANLYFSKTLSEQTVFI